MYVEYKMVMFAALAIGFQRPPPDEIIKALVIHYQKLKSFSAKVIHHGDFLSDVKDSTDTLAWLSPNRFEMVSDRLSIPKIISDGRKLTTFIPQVAPISEPLGQSTGHTPTWALRGGLAFSLMMKSSYADQLLKPQKPVKVSFAYGKVLKWHDVPVSEIISVLSANGASESISYFLTPDYKQLVGLELVSGTLSTWTQYKDVVENPVLPKTLGDIPN